MEESASVLLHELLYGLFLMNTTFYKLLAALMLLSFSGLSNAASVTWTFHPTPSQNVNVSQLASGNSDAAGNYIKATGFTIDTSASGGFFNANLVYSDTWGLYTDGTGHGLNNEGAYVKAILFDFGQAVTLDSVGIAWRGNDADMSVVSLQNDSIGGSTISDLLISSLWGHDYQNVSGNSAQLINSPTAFASQYWLISAFDADYVGDGNPLWEGATDAFKLASVSVSAIPIPATVWLFVSGLLGLIGFSKRMKAA